jgi:hypothetical protein
MPLTSCVALYVQTMHILQVGKSFEAIKAIIPNLLH